jgi:hypothetical protein
MLSFLNRVLDKNKPLFLFNSKMSTVDVNNNAETPSFKMAAIIENDQ